VKQACLLGFLALLSGCAFNRPDHFYVLDSGERRTLAPRTAFATQVMLRVTLPVLVDRGEMVLMNGDDVHILEHERWASPLSDQVTTVLGQDIEARREDVIVAARRVDQSGVLNASISVDVVQLYLQQGSGVRLEARWRLQDGRDGKVSQGRETFTAPAADGGVPSMVRSVDACLGSLADRLVADLPR
jgi:uncharacterized lipoprotein YmbA